MENSTAYDNIPLTIDALDIDQNIDETELVYIAQRSLKIIPITEKKLYEAQKSLRNILHHELSNAGRKSLAERFVNNQSLITYQIFEVLIAQIHKPRTQKTLLDNIPRQFSASSHNLPSLVKEDMNSKGMTKTPNNIHTLHQMSTGMHTKMKSLPLIKYLTNQCMAIDFDTHFISLEKEFKECVQLLLINLNQDFSYDAMDCVSTLNGLRNIWQLQIPSEWNEITLQPSSQACLSHLSRKPILDKKNKSALLPHTKTITTVAPITTTIATAAPITTTTIATAAPITTIATVATTTIATVAPITTTTIATAAPITTTTIATAAPIAATTVTSKKSHSDLLRKQAPKRIKKKTGKKTAHDFPLTLCHEPSTSGQDRPITKDTTSHSDKTPKKPISPPNSIPKIEPKTVDQLPKEILSKQSVSAPSQGARPKEKMTLPSDFVTNLQFGIDIKNQEELNKLIMVSCSFVVNEYITKENAIHNFIINLEDKVAFGKAVEAINSGCWPAGRLYYLLTLLYHKSKNILFHNRINELIEKSAFILGHPPQNLKTGKATMRMNERKFKGKSDAYMSYTILDDVTPTEALKSCFKDFMIADQGIIIELILATALQHIWGATIYNKYFSVKSRPFKLHSSNAPRPCCKLADLLLSTSYLRFEDVEYVKGHLYRFSNHNDYLRKDFSGEYPILYAFCNNDDTEQPHFTVPFLFNYASIHNIDIELVYQYNNVPHYGHIMKKEEWDILKNDCNERLSELFPLAPVERISIEDLKHPMNKDDLTKRSLPFETTKKIKDAYIKILEREAQQEKTKGLYKSPINPKKETTLSTAEVTPVTDSPPLRIEMSTTEKAFKPNLKKTLEKHQSNANKAIRQYHNKKITREEVMKEFLLLKDFYLTLKTEDPTLYKEHEHIYKKIEEKVRTTQEY